MASHGLFYHSLSFGRLGQLHPIYLTAIKYKLT